jgi:hypothetical protein
MDLREEVWESGDWIEMAQHRVQWQVFMNMVMDF